MSNWVDDIVHDFGTTLGLQTFALSERGTAALNFENGIRFALEHMNGEKLAMSMSVEAGADDETAKRILAAATGGIRSAYLQKTGRAIFVKVLADQDLTLPLMNETMHRLWETVENFRSNG